MSLLEIGQKPIDNDNAKVKELENKVNTNKSNITTLQGQFNDISQTVRTHTNIIAENQTNLRNSAKTNVANTFTQNQKIQGQLEIRQNGSAIKVGNTIGNSACYMELFNSNERRAFVGHTSTGSNTFEINNGNADIKLVGNQINVDNKKIVNVANPTNNTDAVNKQYVDTPISQIQGVMQQQGDNITTLSSSLTSQGNRITTLENNTINGKIKYNKTYIFLYERNKYAEYVNVGGFDITIFRNSINTYNDILYTNFFAYDRNWFVISGQMYNSNTIEIIVAKKTGTNYSYPVQVNVSRMERINPGEPISEIQGEQ